ncbi:ABC transporter permease [Nocardia terpenica]|uniref:ABC transporter permease n=1 Tax=Nocardia terpenica TaxID=455432 RepID=UPI000AF270CE|nr:ABC transporter permease [Nocardia terpenica]
MSTAVTGEIGAQTAFPYHRSFLAILLRDIYVTGRDLPGFLAQVALQPLFLLFVFGHVITTLGFADAHYSDLLFPGTIAMSAMLTSLQGTGMPLAIDFAVAKEIEDRLLAPIPLALVATEKILFGALRGVLTGILVFPIGLLMLGSIPLRAQGLPLLVVTLLLGSLVGASLGMVLGTLVPPNQINVVFAVIITPVLFTGCSQYPWPSLEHIPWFQWLTTLNPLTYVSETMRAALVPGVPHIASWICVLMIALWLALCGAVGLWGFQRRATNPA